MNIPKLKIRYASALDHNRRQLYVDQGREGYPSVAVVDARLPEIKKIWNQINEDDHVMKRITELSGIEFPEGEHIEAYVFGSGLPSMSHPLLIPVNTWGEQLRDDDSITEVLIHETVHRFVGDRTMFPQEQPYWDYIRQQYSDEPNGVQVHLVVYAILKTILIELLGLDHTEKIIEATWKSPAYVRAKEVVEQKGAEHFIEEFRKLTA